MNNSMNKPHTGRQVYNKQALSKASHPSNPRKNQKSNRYNQTMLTHPIIEEKNEDESIKEIDPKAVNNNEPTEENTEKDNTKKEKPKKPRLKLDDKTLLYSDNGIKKYYEAIMSTTFKESSSDERNLHKLVDLFKNWHFVLYPKYDAEFFTSRIIDLGKKPSAKAYMSRLRRIYKGLETWDVMFDEQNEILTNSHNPAKNNNKNSKGEQGGDLTQLNNNQQQQQQQQQHQEKMNVQLKPNNNEEDLFDLDLENFADLDNMSIHNNTKKNEEDIEINDKDFDNFQDIDSQHNNNNDNIKEEDFDNFSHSHHSGKRSYKEAFGHEPDQLHDLKYKK